MSRKAVIDTLDAISQQVDRHVSSTCPECDGNEFSCLCDSSMAPVPTPSEAENWPLDRLWAEEIKVGDYLINMGEFMKVIRITTFEPLGAIQILARGDKSGAINYARTNRHRVHDQFWVLVDPENSANSLDSRS